MAIAKPQEFLAPKKNKGSGRAIVLTNEQIVQVEALAACLTIEDITNYLGIAQSTFYEIRNRQPEVLEAYNKGVAKARSFVASKLMGYINEKANTPSKLTAIMFYLRTQAGWSEKQEMNVTTKDVTPRLPDIVVKPKTSYEQELLKRIEDESSE